MVQLAGPRPPTPSLDPESPNASNVHADANDADVEAGRDMSSHASEAVSNPAPYDASLTRLNAITTDHRHPQPENLPSRRSH